MRSILFSLAFLLVSGVFLGAQDANSGTSSAQHGENSDAKAEQTVRGCLSKTGNTYVILGSAPIRQYRIIGGDITAFKGKQNKVVEVTGIVGQQASGASTNGQYGPGSTTGVGYDTIIAKSVKVVIDNCGK